MKQLLLISENSPHPTATTLNRVIFEAAVVLDLFKQPRAYPWPASFSYTTLRFLFLQNGALNINLHGSVLRHFLTSSVKKTKTHTHTHAQSLRDRSKRA